MRVVGHGKEGIYADRNTKPYETNASYVKRVAPNGCTADGDVVRGDCTCAAIVRARDGRTSAGVERRYDFGRRRQQRTNFSALRREHE